MVYLPDVSGPGHRRLSRIIARIAGAAGILGGVLVWVLPTGWSQLGYSAGFIMAGLALLTVPEPAAPPVNHRVWRILVLSLAALGSWELFRPTMLDAPALDIGFILFGAALFLLDGTGLASQNLALLAWVIGVLALLGNVYGVDTPYVVSRGLGIPFGFSSLFLILCAGLFCLRPNRGWAGVLTGPGAGGSMARRLLPAAVLVPALLGWLKVWAVRVGYSGAGLGPITVLALILIFVAVILVSAEAVGREEEARRHVEQELRRTRDELQRLVLEKTTKLEETGAQLIQAQKMEAVGRLAGGVAHDFNNLLTAIFGFTELLLMGASEDDPRTGDLLEIQKAGKRGAALTRQLLAFSRRQLLQPVVLDLNDVVAGVHKMLSRLIGENMRLVFIPGDGVGRVKADPGQLEQVLMNLVVNARDAMPNGGTVTLATSRSGSHAVLSVADTGCGMDEKVLAHLYEPFFTTKEQGKGTGLGLSTVYGIVNQSGGTIDVDSAVGLGTTFRLSFPSVSAEPAGPQSASTGALSGTETILLSEDDPGVRAPIARFLTTRGYTVLAAGSGEEALRLAERAGKIDVLLTDIVMPRMRGDELARKLLLLRPALSVIYMTGYVDESVARLPVDRVLLQKPIALETLARRLREVLDGRAPGA
jgi:signal transduction histidine kinase